MDKKDTTLLHNPVFTGINACRMVRERETTNYQIFGGLSFLHKTILYDMRLPLLLSNNSSPSTVIPTKDLLLDEDSGNCIICIRIYIFDVILYFILFSEGTVTNPAF